eukprot:343286-Chlamydomonas_euryale.AAC.6
MKHGTSQELSGRGGGYQPQPLLSPSPPLLPAIQQGKGERKDAWEVGQVEGIGGVVAWRGVMNGFFPPPSGNPIGGGKGTTVEAIGGLVPGRGRDEEISPSSFWQSNNLAHLRHRARKTKNACVAPISPGPQPRRAA